MEIILSPNCKSFTGTINSKHGYYIQQRNNRFFSKRKAKGNIPPDGHWNFIISCAELAQDGLIVADIKVSYVEFSDAVREAGMIHKIPAYFGWNEDMFMNAKKVLNTKEEYGL